MSAYYTSKVGAEHLASQTFVVFTRLMTVHAWMAMPLGMRLFGIRGANLVLQIILEVGFVSGPQVCKPEGVQDCPDVATWREKGQYPVPAKLNELSSKQDVPLPSVLGSVDSAKAARYSALRNAK